MTDNYLFAIGLTLEELTNLSELTVPVLTVASQHFDYARIVNLGNGGTRGVGSPYHIWNVGLPTLDERNQLKTFCPGASAEVFIYTKLNDGTWVTFQCQMLWTTDEGWWYGDKKTIAITFRNLILIEGS